jgi:hypothetical protein
MLTCTHNRSETARNRFVAALCVLAIIAILRPLHADGPVTMAPPVQAASSGATGSTGAAATVFNWQEIPVNQNVPITRGIFDQGGYQLFDKAGETIVVPFTDNNLYVMKFALSDDGTTYFVNSGTAPILYLPENGYLENASASGARWYPFTPRWHPATPVFLGIAPSWHDYVVMGWYPSMIAYGGYWSNGPFISVGAVFPAFGLFFQIGGAHYDGWAPYWGYARTHPAPYQMTIVNQNVYNYGGPRWQQYAPYQHPFIGTGHAFVPGRGFIAAQGRTFSGGGHPVVIGTTYVGGPNGANGFHPAMASSNESPRGFRGAHMAAASQPDGGHAVQAAAHASHSSTGHVFKGATTSHSNQTAEAPSRNTAGRSFHGTSAFDHQHAGRSSSHGTHIASSEHSSSGGHSVQPDHGGPTDQTHH